MSNIFKAAKQAYLNAHAETRRLNTEFETNFPVPTKGSTNEEIDAWSDASVDYTWDAYQALEAQKKAFLEVIKAHLEAFASASQYKKIAPLFEDKTNLILAQDDIIEKALIWDIGC